MSWPRRYTAKRYHRWHHYTHGPSRRHNYVQAHRHNYSVMRQDSKHDYASTMRRQPTRHGDDTRPDSAYSGAHQAGLPHPSWLDKAMGFAKELMAEFGISAAGACGLVGGLCYESGGLVPNMNQGGRVGAPASSTAMGYGWAQWSGDRKDEYQQFCRENNLTVGSDEASRSFIKHELHNDFFRTVHRLKKQTDPSNAAVVAEQSYEKAGKPAHGPRKEMASLIYGHLAREMGLNQRGQAQSRRSPGYHPH